MVRPLHTLCIRFIKFHFKAREEQCNNDVHLRPRNTKVYIQQAGRITTSRNGNLLTLFQDKLLDPWKMVRDIFLDLSLDHQSIFLDRMFLVKGILMGCDALNVGFARLLSVRVLWMLEKDFHLFQIERKALLKMYTYTSR